MSDSSRYPDTGDNTGARSERGTPPRVPVWVKVSGIIVAVLVLLFLGLKLFGVGGEHSPSRHTGGFGGDTSSSGVVAADRTPSSDVGGYLPLSSVTEHRLQQS